MSEDAQIFDRRLLRARRARFAAGFAEHEFLIAHVATELAERIGAVLREFPLALDLGAHHGLVGRRVAALPNVGGMIYADSTFELAARCPRPSLVCDEDLLPFREPSFNLIVSGLALHRVNDIPGALIQIRRCLVPDGLFMAAALGARSLIELRTALLEAETEIEGGASPHIAPFADVREYGALLQRAGFALPVTDSEIVTVTYATLIDLMRELRAMGGGNVLQSRRKTPLARGTLERAEQIYRDAPQRRRRQDRCEFRDRLSLWLGARRQPAKAVAAGKRCDASGRCSGDDGTIGGRQGALSGAAGTAKQALVEDIQHARPHGDQLIRPIANYDPGRWQRRWPNQSNHIRWRTDPLVSFAKQSKSDITFLVWRIMTSSSVLPVAAREGWS